MNEFRSDNFLDEYQFKIIFTSFEIHFFIDGEISIAIKHNTILHYYKCKHYFFHSI